MTKVNKCVVRNQAYKRAEFSIRERHNERKNECYGNGDILLDRSHLNIHFKKCDDTYEQTFAEMLENGDISIRGQKADAKVFDELIFDVNTEYFEESGGYDFAKRFYEEAYRLAIKEVGDEKYVLSAVMHADERNVSLSETLGHDVFHYHLHVVYIPVVEKEILWTKRCKDPKLVGTVKDIIQQVSHSKKWPLKKTIAENGKTAIVNSYSILQDNFYEHMKNAGFKDFERGERGSTAEHLSDLEYKIKQDTKRSQELKTKIVEQKEQLSKTKKELKFVKQSAHTFGDIECMAKKSMFGKKVELSEADWKIVSELAKEGVVSRGIIPTLKEKIEHLTAKLSNITNRYRELIDKTKDFIRAFKLAPQRIIDLFGDIFRQEKEQKQTMNVAKSKKRDFFSR